MSATQQCWSTFLPLSSLDSTFWNIPFHTCLFYECLCIRKMQVKTLADCRSLQRNYVILAGGQSSSVGNILTSCWHHRPTKRKMMINFWVSCWKSAWSGQRSSAQPLCDLACLFPLPCPLCLSDPELLLTTLRTSKHGHDIDTLTGIKNVYLKCVVDQANEIQSRALD